jgi:urea transport system substrate-binding protein
MDRRSFIRSSAAALAGAAVPLFPTAALAADEMLIGSILDLSGGLDIYGKPMADCMTLAIEEQNAAGGLLGKKLKLMSYDPQSNMQLYTQFAQQAVLKDKVAVVQGGITSASREVIRPVLNRNKTVYFYNSLYEGGVCDRNTFCTGTTPPPNQPNLNPNKILKLCKNIYVLAADYNYGQITSQWVKKFVQDSGGSVASIDFFPLDVTNFGPTISKIEAAKPDMVVSSLVGGSHISFYRQWAAAGLNRKIPLASTTFGVGNEHIVLSAAESDGFLVSYSYFQNLDTPENRAFKERFYKRFGKDYPNITDNAMCGYQGFKLWAEAVKKAGTLESGKVIEALESGITIQGPSGKVSIDPGTHHCVVNVSIAEVKNKQLNVLQTFPEQAPSDTAAVCNLQKNPKDNKQYVIKV